MIWKYIKAINFFEDYAPEVKDHRKKISGKNWRGNPMGFTPEDMKAIKKGIDQLFKDIKEDLKK